MGPPAEISELVAAAPHDDAALAVLADWLLQHGDPRGELVALQLQPERTAELVARIAELHRTLAPVPEGPWLTWRRGFVHRAVLTERTLAMLPALLQSTASWGLRELVAILCPLPQVLAILVEHAAGLPALTSLQLRGAPRTPRQPVDVGPLVARLPRLARLRIDVPHLPFRIASELVELSILTDAPEHHPAWASLPHPELEQLWLRSTSQLVRVPWLVPERFPRLRRLGLVGRDRCEADVTGFELERHEVVVYGRASFGGLPAAMTWSIREQPATADLTAPAALIGMGGDVFPAGALVPLTHDDFRIGRSMESFLRFDSQLISKRHARIERSQGWTLTDGTSTHGTFLEDTAVGDERCPLRNGHDLQFGATLFRFLQGDIPVLAAATRRELAGR